MLLTYASVFMLVLCFLFMNYIPTKAASYYTASMTVINPGEVKQPIQEADLISMGLSLGDFENDHWEYTLKPDSKIHFNWDKGNISKEVGNYPYATAIFVYEGSKQYNNLYQSYTTDVLPDEIAYNQMVLHNETDIVVVEIEYKALDDEGNEVTRYYSQWWALQKDPYNINFKYTTPDGKIIPGIDGMMYRLYNPYSGEHFYTANVGEGDYLTSIGWIYEDYAWRSPTSSNTPVYRLYNPNSGEHHYTTNAGEKDYLVGLGWNYEGIGWYSASTTGTFVYRLFNPYATGAGSHHYTTKSSERDYLMLNGWNYEGVGWYGM